MTSERSNAYGRVMKTLSDVGAVKLHDDELSIVRDAADSLLFASTLEDAAAAEAIMLVENLMGDLTESGRWTAESAQRLGDDIAACGPSLVVA